MVLDRKACKRPSTTVGVPDMLVGIRCVFTLDGAQSPRCPRLLFLGAHISEFQLIGLGEAVNFTTEEQSL